MSSRETPTQEAPPANPLSPDTLLASMAAALPTHPTGDTTSDLSSSYEALALFVHTCVTNLGFRLVGLTEESKDPGEHSRCAAIAPRLPTAWRDSFNSHTFLYAHAQSSMQYVVRVDRMGGKAEVRGLGVGDERIHRLELSVRDWIASAALPLRITMRDGGGQAQTEDRSDLPNKLSHVFIDKERLRDLAALLKINIIQRLIPGLHKEGYEEEGPDERAAREDAEQRAREASGTFPHRPRDPAPAMPEPARPRIQDDPLAEAPRRNPPPGDFPPPDFEDEYEINRPHAGRVPPFGGSGMGGAHPHPYGIGEQDLHPPGLGPHDPLRGSFTPGGEFGGPGGGGMHPTFDDPLFQGAGRRGGDDYDPSAPPGARWDPVGPGMGGPPFGSNRGPRGGRGGGGFGGGFNGDII